jgi:hypothetical protein
MSRNSFDNLVELLQEHPSFHNNSLVQQAPVREQVAIALERLGCNGNSSGTLKLARLGGVSEGSILNYTARVISAILDNLVPQFLTWPSTNERLLTSARFSEKYGFPGCVGIVDGTHVILHNSPSFDAPSYWTRKQQYAINLQVVCDDRRKIIYHQVGYPGSCHDSSCFKKTELYEYPGEFFGSDQYILGDSAYPLSTRLLTPYKGPAANIPSNIKFNEYFSRARVVVEHTMGLLKSRFESLRGLRVRLRKKEDLKSANDWVVAVLALHNFLLQINDSWDDQLLEDSEEQMAFGGSNEASGSEFRRRIQSYVISFYED